MAILFSEIDFPSNSLSYELTGGFSIIPTQVDGGAEAPEPECRDLVWTSRGKRIPPVTVTSNPHAAPHPPPMHNMAMWFIFGPPPPPVGTIAWFMQHHPLPAGLVEGGLPVAPDVVPSVAPNVAPSVAQNSVQLNQKPPFKPEWNPPFPLKEYQGGGNGLVFWTCLAVAVTYYVCVNFLAN